MSSQYRDSVVQEGSNQKGRDKFERLEETAGIVEKYSLWLFVILTGVWFIGRVMGVASGNTIFDPQFIRWVALVIWILLVIFILSKIAGYIKPLSENYRQWPLIFPWCFFAMVIVLGCFTLQGYYTGSLGLFSTFAEWTESLRQSVFLIFKSFSFSPILPINLAVQAASGTNIEAEYINPFVLGYPYILGFFVWSVLYGCLLLFFHGPRGPKVFHLAVALAGLFLLMILKAISMITDNLLIIFHAVAVLMILCQIILTYSSLRSYIRDKVSEQIKGIDYCLPPKAWILCIIVLVFLPILADLNNQYILSSRSIKLMERIERFQPESKDAPKYVVAAEISIRTGPAIGDSIVAVLPKGSIIYVMEERDGWARVGENQWVSNRFLSPIKRD